MEITGYMLMDKIKELNELAQVLREEFDDSLVKFSEEEKRDPQLIFREWEEIEGNIISLQNVLNYYNVNTEVDFMGEKIQLNLAIKMSGLLDRKKNLLKSANNNNNRRGIYASQRNKDVEYAVSTLSTEFINTKINEINKLKKKLVLAIRNGNATPMTMDNLSGIDFS